MDSVHCRGGKEGSRVRFPHGSGAVHEGAEVHEARGSDGEHRPRYGRSPVPAPAPPDPPEQAADLPRMMDVGVAPPYAARKKIQDSLPACGGPRGTSHERCGSIHAKRRVSTWRVRPRTWCRARNG